MILDLHDMFLTHGYHVVTVPSIEAGRELVGTCLASLSCFSSISCLSVQRTIQLPVSVVSLYEELLSFSPTFSPDAIDAYLLERFYFDFCWIEYTPELVSAGWFAHFRARLDDYNLVKSASIVALHPCMGGLAC
jgi:hypothetical protein